MPTRFYGVIHDPIAAVQAAQAMETIMKTKTFEIRDEGTHIPVLCVKLTPEDERDQYILARAGYGDEPHHYVTMVMIDDGCGKATSDPFKWGNRRTLRIAHQHIIDNWDKLENGAVIDVEFILGITSSPKRSEAETTHA